MKHRPQALGKCKKYRILPLAFYKKDFDSQDTFLNSTARFSFSHKLVMSSFALSSIVIFKDYF